MVELTKILSDEHQNILKVIKALRQECEVMEKSQKIDQGFFHQAVDFIRNYADKFHHAKEEDILFREMCRDEVNLHCNPIDQMLHEHNLGRDFVKGLEAGLIAGEMEKVLSNTRGYAQLLEDHIFKEDNILYPMAGQVLSPETQRAVQEEFTAVEKERFSPEVQEKYLALVREFELRKQ